MAMEIERQAEVADRIRALRGPIPQPEMADRVGTSLRNYQRWEAGGGISWDNLQRLADEHDVSTNYLLYGDEKPESARSQLDRIEGKLDALLNHLPTLDDERAQYLGEERQFLQRHDETAEKTGRKKRGPRRQDPGSAQPPQKPR